MLQALTSAWVTNSRFAHKLVMRVSAEANAAILAPDQACVIQRRVRAYQDMCVDGPIAESRYLEKLAAVGCFISTDFEGQRGKGVRV